MSYWIWAAVGAAVAVIGGITAFNLIGILICDMFRRR